MANRHAGVKITPFSLEAPPPYLTIGNAMWYLNVSRRTIYNWMQSGRLRFVRTPGGAPRFAYADIVNGLLQSATAAPSHRPPRSLP